MPFRDGLGDLLGKPVVAEDAQVPVLLTQDSLADAETIFRKAVS